MKLTGSRPTAGVFLLVLLLAAMLPPLHAGASARMDYGTPGRAGERGVHDAADWDAAVLHRTFFPMLVRPRDDYKVLYFAAGSMLYAMNPEGGNPQMVADGLLSNEALTVDPLEHRVYAGAWEQAGQIQAWDMNTGELTTYSDGPGEGGTGIAIDPFRRLMVRGLYYDGVYAMNMDQAGAWQQLVTSDALYPMHGQGGQIALDPVRRQIYFRTTNNFCADCRRIWRVNYDGSGLVQVTSANGANGLALDLKRQQMYFADHSNLLMRSKLDGSEIQTVLRLPEPYRVLWDIDLDSDSQTIFLSIFTEDHTLRAIARANMDGSGFRILHTISGTQHEVHGNMALFVPAGPRPAPPMLVRYDFEGDFATSGVVVDRSGNGHDAQVKGYVGATLGIVGGQAMLLQGDGYVEATTNPAAGKRDVTFSLWFRTPDPESNYKLASGAWWGWGPGSGWIMATHIPEFWSDDGHGVYLPDQANNDNAFPRDAWIHEVVTYDGSRLKEYTNGRLVNDWATTGAALGVGRALAVGAWPMFSGYNLRGAIDEFVIFDQSLTAAEVEDLYRAGR